MPVFTKVSSTKLTLATLALTIMSLPASLRGQAVAIAEVTGLVTDQSGSAVVGAIVRMIDTDKGVVRTLVTDNEGRYVLPNLPSGPYRLEVQAKGFKDYVQSGIQLQVGNKLQINVTLQVGAVTETVEVQAAASMVEVSQTGVSTVIDGNLINELPLNGRQATSLVLGSGAAVTAPGGGMVGSKNYFSSTTISVAGGQANGTAYLLDGGDNTDTMTNVNLPFPFPDALQEFSVETSALSARFGAHPGATVNVVTKSGANQFHGDLFEYLRNGNVNARNTFAARHDTLKRNQFGGTIGGKLITDKLFFFGGTQITRQRSDPPQTTSYVPTAAALRGDFSSLASAGCQSSGRALNLNDPNAPGQIFPGAQIPLARLNAPALKLATEHLPSTNDPCGKIIYGIPTHGDEDQVIGRVDYVQSSKHTIFGRYFLAQYANPPVYDGKNLLTTTQPGNLERVQAITLGDNFTLGAGTLNAFHAGFTRRRDDRGPASNQISPADIGVNIYSRVPNFLLVSVSNFFSVGCGTCAPGHFNVNTWQLADDVDLIRGRHQIQLGVNFIRTQNNLISGFNENGTFGFNGNFTTLALADFLIGRPNSFNQTNPTPDDLRQTVFGLYIQDTFRVSSRLTLSAGLRWSPFFPNTDKYNRGTYFDFPAFAAGTTSTVYKNAPAGLFFVGDPGFSRSLWDRHLPSFAPRVGASWDPRGNGRDVLRMGAAILYDTTEVFFDERKTTNPPYGGSVDIPSPAGGFTNPYLNYPGGNPFPPNGTVTFPIGGVYINMPRKTQPTYMAQWNASYQKQLPGNWLASVTYLGNKTTHMWVGSEVNPARYIPGASTTGNTNQRRLLYLQSASKGQYYASINQADEGSNAHYNALLLSLQHRFSHGFTLVTNYTDSYCITDLDFTGELGGAPSSQPGFRGAERGPCNYDYRHIFNAGFVATSKVAGHGWAGRLLSSWRLAPFIRATSGQAITVTSGRDNSLNGTNQDRPVQIAQNVYPANQSARQWILPLGVAFQQNATGTYGNVGRDALRGPGFLGVDASLSRIIHLRERWRVEARFEAFNAVNHVNLNNPNTNLTSSTFGTITAAGDPRILQFAMKLHF
jgi:Carboxypeptidase regulatory-like domain